VAFAAATPANAKPVNLQATGSLKTVLTGVATGVPPRPA
jgi:hypothetical protein